MKVMITLNMPNSNGMPLHKLIAETKENTIGDLWETLCENEFIIVTQFYVTRPPNGDAIWDNLGPVILNTSQIAKVQEYVQKDIDDDYRGPSRNNQRPQYRR